MGSNTSYSSPKVGTRKSAISDRGLFAKESIQKGELIISLVGARGKFINSAEADRLYDAGDDHVIQVEDNLFFNTTSEGEIEKEDHINRSCDPNCGIMGKLEIVAMRNIQPDEEITFDYTTSESSDYKMECRCGSKNCRKIITGDDWKILELQKRYKGYFSDYLQKKIENLDMI